MKNFKRILALCLSALICISAIPLSVFAAPASDLPDNMIDSPILRALEYTGYDVQAQKDNGTLYQSGSYSSKTPANIRSNIHYGTALSGKETVANSSTKTGLAPDIAKFEQYGLCCAGFVTYYVCNYLPNIEGADTQFITDTINATGWNSQAVVTWQKALDNLVSAGQIEKIGTSPSNVNRSKLAPGDLIIFGNDEDSTTHIGVYSGTYNGRDFMIHLGSDMGPEIMPVDWMSNSSNGVKTSDPNGYYHMPENMIKSEGNIEIYKTSTDGAKLSGASFVATSTTNPSLQYYIGPTDSNGYASISGVEYSTYTVKETVFPTNYREYGTSSWNVTLDKNTPNNTVTINAVNEIIPGSCKVIKVSEDNKVDGIEFRLRGNGVDKTIATSNGGIAVFDNLKPGIYTVTEEILGQYIPNLIQNVTIVSGQTTVVNFSNTLKRGDLKVTKTSDDKDVDGFQFKLTGTSMSGETIEQYAETNSVGVATFKDVLISGKVKYVLTEINVPEKYETPKSVSVEIVWNEITNVAVENKLKRGNIKIKKTSEDGNIEAIKFKVYGTTLGGKKFEYKLQTSEKGECGIVGLPISGNEPYTVEEYNAPSYYVPNDPQKIFLDWNETEVVPFHNELKRGNLTVRKTSEDGLVEGMKFRLQGTSDSGIKVDEYATTDKNGIAQFKNILIGKDYVLSEVNTPQRYVIPSTQELDITWNETTEVKVHNVLKKWRASVFKIDGHLYWPEPVSIDEDGTETSTLSSNEFNSDELVDLYGYPFGIAQGNATLKGAVYGVYKNGELVDTYTTDKNGWFITKYYPVGDNNKWTIKEISPSQGYLLDETIYTINSNPGYYFEELNTEYLNVLEAVIRGKIEIYKHFGDGNTTDLVTPEENAVFQVYLKSAGSYDNAKDKERSEIVTNSYGYAITKDLPYGVYVVEQVDGKEGKELMPPFEVTISDNGRKYPFFINNATFEADVEIVKKDATTGKVIPVSGIGFKVRNTDTGEYIVQHINYPTPMDIDVYYTDTTGKLMLPYALPYGNYEIIEQNTCYGYVLDSTPVAFTVDGSKDIVTVEKYNEPQMGIINILKKGEVFSSVVENKGVYVPVYSEQGLAGAEFNIYAAEDIYTPDGTLRYEKGQQVYNMTTNNDGIAESELLHLGKYEIREVNSPYGTVLNNEPIYVELIYAGELVSITHTEGEFKNERQKVIISLIKELEKDDKFSIGKAKEYVGVKFGLYAAESLIAADGTEIPKDGILEEIHIDENGNGVFTVDIPVGAKLYVKEISTDCHYVLSEEKFPVEFIYEGQDVGVVQLLVNNGQAIQNKIIRGSIDGIKTDEDNNPIEDVVFGLFSADETVFTDKTAILTAITDEDGYFIFENIPFGKWIIKELSCPKEYVLSDKLYDINITKDGELLSLAITNEFVSGTVRVIKLCQEDNNKKLGGAIFELYIDTDNNGVFDPNVDKLVGTLTEKELGVYEYGNLRYGGYFVYESKAPDEYIKDDRYFYFKITEAGQTVVIENEKGVGFVNEPIPIPEPEPEVPTSPQTGDNTNIWSAIIMALSSLVIITITSIKLKKHKKS